MLVESGLDSQLLYLTLTAIASFIELPVGASFCTKSVMLHCCQHVGLFVAGVVL